METRFDISAGELKLHLEENSIEEVKKEEIPNITLAPFTTNTKIFFENVPVGTMSSQKLIVNNPNAKVLKVTVKSLPPNDRNVRISWESNNIPANESAVFEIFWNPMEVDSWMHTISFQFGRCLKKDLPVIFKSIAPKKIIKKQITTKKNLPKRLQNENPKQNKLISTPKSHKSIIKTAIVEDKENVIPFKRSVSKIQFSFDNSFNIFPLTGNSRRDTYDVIDAKFNHIREDLKNISDDSLEMPADLNNSENDLLRPLKNSNNFYSNSDNCIIKKKSKLCKPKVTYGVNETELFNMSSETYVNGNISSTTYVKGNISSETYVKDNLSTETYVKDVSSNTYVKDEPLSAISPIILKNNTWTSRKSSSLITNSSVHMEDDFNLSPIFHSPRIHQKNMSGVKIRKIIEADLWGKSQELCFEEYSPTRDLFRKRKSDVKFEISPAKRPYIDNSKTGVYKNHLDWNKTKKVQKSCYTGTSYFDPFMSESTYRNQEWMEKQEIIFKNWLNALLTPPVELDSNVDDQPINVAKLWQECKQKSVPIAPSKENVSIIYHTNHRLDSLRKSAFSLFRSSEVAEVLAKIALNVENQRLSIRADKNVHLDLGLQSEIMTLLLSYNPLWLRIGLETIYNTCITLSSNSDIMGLSNFLMQKFFKDSFLLQKHKMVLSPKYMLAIKKFILKKFLELVYFLDLAKCKVLIGHDPCLFRRNAPVKESREIILAFSRELLSSVGDVTRLLRIMGYVVNHKQTYLHEFNYSVAHLGVDLRDGVRLTKVMEIILIRNNLTECLRVPAVSRLQKIHNMKLVFDALLQANFEIVGDIGPKDIVDGHHEKTLSFLWQIIYKFQAPLMVNASIKIQNWWRSLPNVLKRRIKARHEKLRVAAAVKIQRWYRRHLLASKLIKIVPFMKDILRQKLLLKSAIIIQNAFKMYFQKKRYRQLKTITILIQSRVRGYLLRENLKYKLHCVVTIQASVRMWIKRKEYLRIYASVIYLQQVYRAKQLMIQQRQYYQRLKASTLTIQELYRGNRLMKITRQRYLTIKAAVITIQLRYRAFMLMKSERNKYQHIRYACIIIQNYYRSYQVMKKNVKDYGDLKRAVLIIQQRFRANQAMKTKRIYYKKFKKAVICVQSQFRANRKMRVDYANYKNLKKAVLYIQTVYRATQIMKIEYSKFNCLKSTVICIQKRYRANKLMKIERHRYLEIKTATVLLQRQFKAYLLMKIERKNYQKTRNAIIIIQRNLRAHQAMKKTYNVYNNLKRATLLIQRKFRNNQLMKRERAYFNDLKVAVIFVQTKFRANKIMRIQRADFENFRNVVKFVQSRYRANQLRKIEFENFNRLKRSAIIIQNRFKANKSMKIQRRLYQDLRTATIIIQRRFRANKLMQVELSKYKDLMKATLVIQAKLRATLIMKTEVLRYDIIKKAVVVIQTRYRANQLMKIEKEKYAVLKKSVMVIQARFRAHKAMKIQSLVFQNLVKATIIIQRKYRSNKLMRTELANFMEKKKAAIVIQSKVRATNKMKIDRSNYLVLKKACIRIQILYRANRLTKLEHTKFIKLREAAITIQQRYRSYKVMQNDLARYKKMKAAVMFIQTKFRANLVMKTEYYYYQNLKNAVILIQRRYRANQLMNFERCRYRELKSAAIVVQKLFRSRKLTIFEQTKYQKIQNAVVVIQQRFKAHQIMKIECSRYKILKSAAIVIQRRYRASRMMRLERAKFIKMKDAAVLIQQRYRVRQKLKKINHYKFCQIKRAAIIIQRSWRKFISENNKYKLKKLQTNAAIKLQAFWRGYKIRKEHPEVHRIRKNVEVLTLNASPQNTLQNRKERAIRILTDTSTLLQILHALEDLDFITRRCKNTLISMSETLPEQLYVFISCANRSPAEMELSTVAVSILINFYKYQDTSKYAWVPSHVNKLILVMSHCCDKEDKLFPYLCTLIWLFAHNEEYKQFICSLPTFTSLFRKINCLCLRKQRMVLHKNPSIASYFRSVSDEPQPLLIPDWGLDYIDRPRTFKNSIHALTSVLRILDFSI